MIGYLAQQIGSLDPYANSLAVWDFENNYSDSTPNGYNLTVNNSVPFSTTNGVVHGVRSVGPFAGNALNATVGNSLIGTSGWTIEGYFETGSTVAQYVLCAGGTVGDHIAVYFYLGTLALIIDDTVRINSTAISINTKYYFAVKSTASNSISLYWNLASDASATLIGTWTGAGDGNFPANGQVLLGANAWSPAVQAYGGYLDYVRVSNIARTSLPSA